MAAFPSTLPMPTIDNYGGSQDLAFIRTEMEAGSVRQRQRFSAANHQMTMGWFFSPSEMTTFKTFFDDSIGRGADWFTMSVDTGDGIQSYDARFTQAYQYSRVEGGYWRVTANIEVRGA